MDEKKKQTITAAEARNLAETSSVTLNRIYKLIRDVAKENEISINYGISSISGKAFKAVVDDLTANGYTVTCTMYDPYISEDPINLKTFDTDVKDLEIKLQW